MRIHAPSDYTIIGIVALLTIVFGGLKLAGVIDWSLWWVLSPVWGLALVVAAVCLWANAVAALSWRNH